MEALKRTTHKTKVKEEDVRMHSCKVQVGEVLVAVGRMCLPDSIESGERGDHGGGGGGSARWRGGGGYTEDTVASGEHIQVKNANATLETSIAKIINNRESVQKVCALSKLLEGCL